METSVAAARSKPNIRHFLNHIAMNLTPHENFF